MGNTYTTWNSTDKAINITLSNGDLTATESVGGSSESFRSVLGVNSGKWYWEITINTGVGYDSIVIGIANYSASLTTYIGVDVNGYSYGGYGETYHAGVIGGFNQYGTGDIISVALDMDTGKIWWAKNGSWEKTGDPGAGTGEQYSGISDTFYAAASLYTLNDQLTANFGASAFSYTVPGGFNSGFYTLAPIVFTFSNPTPEHLFTVYGTTEQLQLTTTISGEEESYTYDAAFYDGFGSQIGTTVLEINSGSSATSNAYLSTPSGIDYNWYVTVTSSGSEDTSTTYTFSNRFLYEGYVTENGDPVSRVVRLYYRDTGELIDSTTSSGNGGYYNLDAITNDEHFIVAFDDEAGEDYNSLILDRLLPNGE